jgi:hypothetical protein
MRDGGSVILRLALGVSLAVLLPACGFLSSRHNDSAGSLSNSEVALEVESHHWNDIVIYLMNGSQSERLGLVNGVSTKQFVFPFRKLTSGGKARLRAYAVGGAGSITSEDLLVQPGQWIKWTLESDLRRSSLAIH